MSKSRSASWRSGRFSAAAIWAICSVGSLRRDRGGLDTGLLADDISLLGCSVLIKVSGLLRSPGTPLPACPWPVGEGQVMVAYAAALWRVCQKTRVRRRNDSASG